MNKKFYKLFATEALLNHAAKLELSLFSEMVSFATDDIKFKRRARFLKNLSEVKAQLLNKISNFDTDNPGEYIDGVDQILIELDRVVSRNA
jgi:hypothetical protein